MAITAFQGPLVAFGTPASTSPGEGNSQRGPSLWDCGSGLYDPRAAYGYDPGDGVTAGVWGFYNNEAIVDVVLSSASSNAFVISSNTTPVAGAAITITPSTAKDTKTTTIVAPENGATVSVTCLGSTAAHLTYGSDATARIWNPAGIVGRCISIVAASIDGGSWSVAGRDIYGYKQTESVLASTIAATAVTTKKAFKYISSILATTTVASTGVGIGLTNTLGFPMSVASNGGFVSAFIVSTANSSASGSVALASASFVAADATSPATTTTGDVRGTYASTTAANGILRFQMFVTPTPLALQLAANADYTGMFGVAQFSSV